VAETKLLPERHSCPKCGSSDARRAYNTGGSYCFSCKALFESEREVEEATKNRPGIPKAPKPKLQYQGKLPSVEEIKGYLGGALEDRKISAEIMEAFGVKLGYNDSGTVNAHYYPYGKEAYKMRRLPKDFFWCPAIAKGELFGRNVAFTGGKRRITIVEGEIDALSIAQAGYEEYEGKIYPVVSIPSASDLKPLLANREWLRSFEEIIIFFDNDEPGQVAAKDAAKILGADKVKFLITPRKDANDILVKDGTKELTRAIFNAERYVPSGIIKRDDVWLQLEEYNNIQSLPYPPCLEGLNQKIKGIRFGEIALFVSGTGSGKSTMLREIMLHLRDVTDDKIGIIELEASPAETARKLAGMALEKNPAKEEIPIKELSVGFEKVFGTIGSNDDERIIILDHQGSVDDSDLMEKLEYMAVMGCRYLFIDHITILVSEGAGRLSGNEAQDKVMNDLLRLCKKHNVWVGLVSHLRKTPSSSESKTFEEGKMPTLDDIRGSGSIKQISFDIIGFARNMLAKTTKTRNSIYLSVLKSRYTGLTGSVDGCLYSYDTGRLSLRTTKTDGDEDCAEFEDESHTITELQ